MLGIDLLALSMSGSCRFMVSFVLMKTAYMYLLCCVLDGILLYLLLYSLNSHKAAWTKYTLGPKHEQVYD